MENAFYSTASDPEFKQSDKDLVIYNNKRDFVDSVDNFGSKLENTFFGLADIPAKLFETIEIGFLLIGGLVAFGVYKSLSQSDVTNIGTGVSKVIKSVK